MEFGLSEGEDDDEQNGVGLVEIFETFVTQDDCFLLGNTV